MAKILIIGTGAWGTALSQVLLSNHHNVTMYGVDDKQIADLKQMYNRKCYGNVKLSYPITKLTSSLEDAMTGSEYIIIAIPTEFINQMIDKMKTLISENVIIINVAKGLDPESENVWSKTFKSNLKLRGYVTLIGPSFAYEVFHKQATIVNVVSSDIKIAHLTSLIFNNDYFLAVPLNDEIGAELSAALKNCLAIATGMMKTFHPSINTLSAILAQGAREISDIVSILGGKQASLLQYCGIGDIFLTCTDSQSRNYSFGQQVSKFGVKTALEKGKTQTVEGYKNVKIAYDIIVRNKLNAPLLVNLYNVLYQEGDPSKLIINVFKDIQIELKKMEK